MKHNGLNPNASSTRKLVYDNIAKQWNHYEKLINKAYESKIKGADGKACWDGYRYAGTVKGKDKCIPVKKSK